MGGFISYETKTPAETLFSRCFFFQILIIAVNLPSFKSILVTRSGSAVVVGTIGLYFNIHTELFGEVEV